MKQENKTEEFEYNAGMDVADTIGLIIIMGLLVYLVGWL